MKTTLCIPDLPLTIFDYILCDKSVLIKLSDPDQCKNWFTSEGIVAKVMLNHNAEIGRDAYFGDYEEVADDEDYEDL